jgi:tetratricopeptide (TPR) repeat protein
MTRRLLPAAAALSLTLLATPVWSGPFVPTQKEFYVLPEHCKASISQALRGQRRLRHNLILMPEAEIARWRRTVGPDFARLQPYCAGLVLLSRALDPVTPRAERGALFRQAAQQIDSTLFDAEPGTALWLEMSLKYARALDGSGNRGRAAETYRELVESYAGTADVWTAYAQFLKRRGELNEAIGVLETGLSSAGRPGPLLFWLANYYFELGDFEKAASTADRAEAAGMKVDRLRRRLGQLD